MASNVKKEIQLARRQKRLRFWKEQFGDARVPGPSAQEADELLNTFSLLIAKMANAKTDTEAAESDKRLIDIERQLASLYEAYRLVKSDVAPRTF